MIKTKADLKYYLKRDAIALKKSNKKRPSIIGDEIWKFQRTMRKLEYLSSLKGLKRKLHIVCYALTKLKYKRLSLKLGFSIPINVFEEGLCITHYGSIVINSKAKIGKNCKIGEGVNIGATDGSDKAPVIGDNVFIATGVKIIGDVSIADDVQIGANAVVVKSISEKGCTYAGIPAKKISDNNSRANLTKELFI